MLCTVRVTAIRKCGGQMDKDQCESFDKAFALVQNASPDNKPIIVKRTLPLEGGEPDIQKVCVKPWCVAPEPKLVCKGPSGFWVR